MDVSAIKKRVPWFLKIPIKLALHKIPMKERLLRGVMFRWGDMDIPAEAFRICEAQLKTLTKHMDVAGKTILELGPGDSLSSAIFFHAVGAGKTYLLDNGDYATKDAAKYHAFIDYLGARLTGKEAEALAALRQCGTLEELLRRANASYLTGGLADLRAMPPDSVDYIFSNNVLEHILLEEFLPEMKELHRVSRGVSFHRIDYKDHLQDGVCSLKFSDKVWESGLFQSSGFYTNRLRHNDVRDVFSASGYRILEDEPHPFERDITKTRVHKDFAGREDLTVATADITLGKV